MLDNLQRDIWALMVSRGVRAFAFSYLNVVFTIYLAQLGYSTVTIGLVISTASASSAVLTALWGFLSDRYGRKKILILLALLTIVSNTIYIFFCQLAFIFLAVTARSCCCKPDDIGLFDAGLFFERSDGPWRYASAGARFHLLSTIPTYKTTGGKN